MTIAQFEKVSLAQFAKDVARCYPIASPDCVEQGWKMLTLPSRSTIGSAGYDFRIPFDLYLTSGETALIPSGVRCNIDDGWMLAMFPRSGLGFKHRLQLDNTVGIIDSDYFHAENEGHIMIKVTNDSKNPDNTLVLRAGDRFAQGIFIPYGIAVGDCAEATRKGGFGSTGK